MIRRTFVKKRSNQLASLRIDKILKRIVDLASENEDYKLRCLEIDPLEIVKHIINNIYDGIETREIDKLTAIECQYKQLDHPDYAELAARLVINDHEKNVKTFLSSNFESSYQFLSSCYALRVNGLMSDHIYNLVCENADLIDKEIDYSRDYLHDYIGFDKLQKSFLHSIPVANKKVIVQTPQDFYMFVALGIHCTKLPDRKKFSTKLSEYEDKDNTFSDEQIWADIVKQYADITLENQLQNAFETYHLLSKHYIAHATPTLARIGMSDNPTCSSCFVLPIKNDSISGIYNTLKECANISKSAGGIGVNIHNVRERNSVIKGSQGISSGIVPMLRVYNETAQYVNQAGNRPGAIAIYLEPWHPDFRDFLQLKNPVIGDENMKSRTLFYGAWIPNLFWEYCRANKDWYFISPTKCPELCKVHGEEFETLYAQCIKNNLYHSKINAKDLLLEIITAISDSGTPYLLAKDEINAKSNHSNLGTIRSSNLCTEIMEYNDKNETAVCNLASIALNKFVQDGQFRFDKLCKITKVLVNNLNRIIDINCYPSVAALRSNIRHRPIGIGVQGLAETFIQMGFPFDSNEAIKLDAQIFETIYYAALTQSYKLAKKNGYYPSMKFKEGAPISKGIFQFDMWVKHNGAEIKNSIWDWEPLRKKIITNGVRNSLLVAPMPTSTTAIIYGNTECFEPIKSNIEKRRTNCGEYLVVNKHLIMDLVKLGIWNPKIKNQILKDGGSVQNITEIPENIRAIYRTAWDIDQRNIIDHSAARGIYIDQSNSQNLYVSDPSPNKLTRLYIYAYTKGLKTICYYLHSRTEIHAQTSNLLRCDEECTSCAT